jgi:hypothetical protein
LLALLRALLERLLRPSRPPSSPARRKTAPRNGSGPAPPSTAHVPPDLSAEPGTAASPAGIAEPTDLSEGSEEEEAPDEIPDSGAPPLPDEEAPVAPSEIPARAEMPAATSAASSRRVSPPRPRPMQVARPSGRNVLPEQYVAWNRVIAGYCQHGAQSGNAYLTVTPSILAAAWLDTFREAREPMGAEADFARAVGDAYHQYVLREPQGLWVLSHIGDDGLPDSVAFLAVSVLAAYEMRADEDAGSNAFYFRLAELLRVDMAGPHPRGFTTRNFDALWRHLDVWTREQTSFSLAMPTEPGVRRFIALPLTHAPLRRMDIDKLPDFFVWASYEAGTRLDVDLVERDLVAWERARASLSRPGAEALADDRRRAVASQVALELEAWDGRFDTAAGRRSASVQLQLDFVRRQPLLHYLPRRPAGFPDRFDDGAHVFESSEEGWYDPVPVPDAAGRELAEGFAWIMPSGSLSLELRRGGATAIAMAPSPETTGFISRRGLAGGLRCAVLCQEDVLGDAQSYLSSVAERPCVPIRHPSLPEGWHLFPDVVARRHEDVPERLEALEVGFAAEIIPVGGLRLGLRSQWLAGAAPTVFIGGRRGGRPPVVDGEEVELRDDGSIDDAGRLNTPGEHLIQVDAARRRLEVVEPQMNMLVPEPLVDQDGRWSVALPADYQWAIVGAQWGEMARPDLVTDRGVLAHVDFQPQWALACDAGPKARALCVSDDEVAPSTSVPKGSVVLTDEQYAVLDELGASSPEDKVVGVAAELGQRYGQLPAAVPIVRDGDGALHVLAADGNLVDATDPSVLRADSPHLQWAAAIYATGPDPFLGSARPRIRSKTAEFWSAYYGAACQLEPLLRTRRR